MVHVLLAGICLFGSGTVALIRVRKEVPQDGRVGPLTLTLMLLGFFGAGVAAVLAAVDHVWLIPLRSETALILGTVVGLLGVAICLAARWRFTFRQAWGLEFDTLVTTGIYRWSRNPQVIGWFLLYVGVGFAGRSGAALFIAALFLLAFIPWILAEERAMESRFGDAYRAYCKQTRRFV